MEKKVFITYSWDNLEHKEWVRSLADHLVYNGIDVFLDQYDITPGDSFTQFMEKAIEESDRVIVVLTPLYKEKSINREGGVGYEQQIITGQIMSGILRNKFIPIIKSGSYELGTSCAVPAHFQGISIIDFRSSGEYVNSCESLMRTIYETPKFKKPVKGNFPSFVMDNVVTTKYTIALDKNFICTQEEHLLDNIFSEISDKRKINQHYEVNFKIEGISEYVDEFDKLNNIDNLDTLQIKRKNLLRDFLNQSFYLPKGTLYEYLELTMNNILDNYHNKYNILSTLRKLSTSVLNSFQLHANNIVISSDKTPFDVFNAKNKWSFRIYVEQRDLDKMYNVFGGPKNKMLLTAVAGLDAYDLTDETFFNIFLPKLTYKFTLDLLFNYITETDKTEYLKIDNWKIGLA